jgi:hypothetical protein
MKLQQNTNKVIRSDSFEESKFTIEASAKAFSILSDGLYADKIKAVIRELSTNAYDAHIEVGKGDEPFLVHLPNRFEPNFYIRDYGTGLSHEDCMNLYTTYFGSTKTDSNDAIGCLGLGSKSPFAYTDSFTVTSYFNGEKRVYNSFKNEHDEPVFVLLSEEASDEVNGIEVMLSVAEYDVEEFKDKAQEIYQYFKVIPKFDDDTEIVVPEYLLKGSIWGLQAKDNKRSYHQSFEAGAIMGQVRYPIDVDQIEDSNVRSLLNSGVEIHFDIGDLDITPSRESLSYNEYTKKSIIDTCGYVIEEMKEVLQENFDDCESLYGARVKFQQLKHSPNTKGLAEIINAGDAQWNGQNLWEGEEAKTFRVHKAEGKNTLRTLGRERYKSTTFCKMTEYVRFDHNQKMTIILDDLKRGSVGRSKAFAKSKNGDDKWSESNHLMYLISGMTMDEVLVFLSCTEDDVTLASSLPTVSSNKSYSSSGEQRSKLCMWKERRWQDVDVDMSAGGYFVEINRYDIVDLEGERNAFIGANSLIEAIKDITGEPEKEIVLYGIKSQELKKKKFNSEGQWTNLLELLSEVRNEKLEEVKESIVSYCEFENFNNDSGSSHLEKASEFLEVVPNDIKEYLEGLSNMKSFKTVYSAIKRSCHWVGKSFKEEVGEEFNSLSQINTWDVKWDKLIETYPMLIFVGDSRYWHDDVSVVEAKYKSVADYIVLVNKSL